MNIARRERRAETVRSAQCRFVSVLSLSAVRWTSENRPAAGGKTHTELDTPPAVGAETMRRLRGDIPKRYSIFQNCINRVLHGSVYETDEGNEKSVKRQNRIA